MSDFTPEQVERAAEALWLSRSRTRFAHCHFDLKWEGLVEDAKALLREDVLAVLSAAGTPERTPEFESREQELFKHQPVLSMLDGGVVGCQCMDRVFYGKTEDWGTHLAEVFDLLSAAGAPEKAAPVVDEAALFGVITDAVFHASNLEDAGTVIPYMNALARSKLAAAVAAYLRGESK